MLQVVKRTISSARNENFQQKPELTGYFDNCKLFVHCSCQGFDIYARWAYRVAERERLL